MTTSSDGLLYFRCAGNACAGKIHGYPATTTALGYALTPDRRKLCYNCAAIYVVNLMMMSGRALMFLDTSHGDPLIVDTTGVIRFRVDKYGKAFNSAPGADKVVDVFEFKGPDGGKWRATLLSSNPLQDLRVHCWRETEPASVHQIPSSTEYLFPTEYVTIAENVFDSLAMQGGPK